MGLDAIVLTALAKEPSERYSTAQAFNDDLGAWFAGKPVRAQTPTLWYLLKKFIARHKLTVSVGAASMVAVFASAGLAIWEAKKASLAAQTTGEVKQFLVDMLSVNSGRKSSALSAQANRETSAEQLLKTAAKKMVDNPKIAPQVRNELLSLMGDLTYELHMNDDAAKLRTQRLATVSNPKDKAQAFLDLIDTYYQAGNTKEADEIVAQAKAFAPTVPSKIKTLFDARLLMREGRQLDFVGKHTQSTLLLAEASKALKAMSPAHEEWIEAQSHYLDGLRHTNPDATLSGYAALLESLETEHGASAAALIPVVRRYAATLGMQQKVPEAKKIFDRLIALHTAHPDYDPMGATLAQADQASMLRTWGDFAAARPQLERALAAFEKAKISGHPGEPTTAKIFYAALLLSDWDFSKADKRFSEVERVSRTSTRPLLTASILEIRASSAMQQGRSNEARAWLTEALATRKAALPPSHMTFRLNEGRVIANEVAAGNIESALALYAQLRTFSVPAIPELPAMLLEGARIEGMTALSAAKKWTDFLEDSQAISSRPNGSPLSAQRKLLILVRRAEAHTELGQYELAMQSLAQADTLSNELASNALQPLRAQLALQKLATLARSKRSPEAVTLARSDFLSQRALLKGESVDFKKMADQVMADLKRF